MRRRALGALLASLLAEGCLAAPAPAPRVANRIVVDKSEHRMEVYAGDKLLASYDVALGVQPVGAKHREGDRKTPEGSYLLDFKKQDSDYFRAIHVSYPNRADREQARRGGYSPGGSIMVHGQPNDARIRAAIKLWPYPDWTNGCIALSNADMQALWDMVRVPTPIEIRP